METTSAKIATAPPDTNSGYPPPRLVSIKICVLFSGKPVSAFIRDLALGFVRHPSHSHATARELNHAVLELRKISAMMRGLYSKNDLIWTNEEKRRCKDDARMMGLGYESTNGHLKIHANNN